MLLFLVCLVVSSVVAIDLGVHPSSLYQNYIGAYAQNYEDYKPHDYEFGYGVSDPYTGDHKSQWEVKERGVVRGGYSLLEPDGTTRVVEYLADDHGFRAVVKKIDQHGNAQVESHGNNDAHHEVAVNHVAPLAPVAQIASVAPIAPAAPIASSFEPIIAAEPEPIYQSYDGHVDNYIQNVEPVVVGKLDQPIEPYPLVQKQIAYAPQQVQTYAQQPIAAVQQDYYQEPIVQKEIAYAQSPVVVQKPISYASIPTIQKQIYSTPIVQKQIAPTAIPQYYSEEPVYKQQPIYDHVISKSPYVVDINTYGPKSDAVYVQPKAAVYQQQYDLPESLGYYGQPNVLTPVAKGLTYQNVAKSVYAPSEYNFEEFVQPDYYGGAEGAYTLNQEYPTLSAKAYPVSYKSVQQLPYQQVVGHPILH